MSFRREKFVPDGGPDGGDGGRGGDVVVVAEASLTSLSTFRDRRSFRAQNGRPGAGALKHGRDAADLLLPVPVGTVVSDAGSGEPIVDLVEAGQRAVVAAGGRGGRGNTRFATPTRQAPRAGELGAPGARRRLHLELKLIADIGLVGLPNAGKSTLLAALTGARPRIGDYPFTTLSPNLGVATLDDGAPVVVADVPGLIEGAHRGAGLGIDFLRHLERTRMLVEVVDVAAGAAAAQAAVDVVDAELAAHSAALAATPRLVALNKLDVPGAAAAADELGADTRFRHAARIVAATGEGCRELLDAAGALVAAERGREAARHVPAAAAEHRSYRRRPRRHGADVAVAREGDAWRIVGDALEREVAMTDLESDEAAMRLAQRFRTLGVDDALRGAGVRPRDTVRVGGAEFEWVPDGPDDTGPVSPR